MGESLDVFEYVGRSLCTPAAEAGSLFLVIVTSRHVRWSTYLQVTRGSYVQQVTNEVPSRAEQMACPRIVSNDIDIPLQDTHHPAEVRAGGNGQDVGLGGQR